METQVVKDRARGERECVKNRETERETGREEERETGRERKKVRESERDFLGGAQAAAGGQEPKN